MDNLQDLLYKWYQERIESEDFSESLFEAKGIELINEFGEPSTKQENQELLRKYLKHFENQQKSTNCKSRNLSENSQNLAQETDKTKQELDAEKFIREFNHQLEEKNIKRDNIYTMLKISFKLKPYFQCTHQDKNEIIEKLRNNRLFIIFCTNATSSHKLSPFYIYEYEDKRVIKYLKNKKNKKNIVFTKENTPKNKIFADWYNNFFMKLVKKHQQKTNANGKVLLVVENYKEFILPEDVMQKDNFEILFFPLGTSKILQPLKLLKQEIRYKFSKTFEDFYTSYDMEIFVKAIYELWTNISPTDIKFLWSRLLKSNSLMEENPTSLVEQTSELIQKFTKEDTICRQLSANRDKILIDSLFSKIFQNCPPVFRKTENATSTCVKQTSELTENVIEEDIALEETPEEINEKMQYLFSKIDSQLSRSIENAKSASMVKQMPKSVKNVTVEDIALEETSTEIKTEIKEQKNIEIKSDNFKELIQQHVKLRSLLRTAVHSVMIDNKSISDVTESYELDIEILQLKIDILKDRRKYLERKIKYEAAIKDIISKKRSKNEAVRHYKVNKKILGREMARRKQLGKKYTFDRKVMSKSQVYFTFQEEQLLLKFLAIWAKCQQKQTCYCSICALKYLSILAYELAQENNIKYPKDWDIHKRADFFWLREFEMKYSNDILILLFRSAYISDSKNIMNDEQQLLYLFDKYIKYNF